MKLFSDKVAYRFNQPLSELQINKANFLICQHLTESGVTITAKYSDRIEFKTGFFSGRQTTLSRMDRGIIYISSESLKLKFYSIGFVIIPVFIAFPITIVTRNFFLPLPVAIALFFLHKLISKSIVREALSDLGRRLEFL